MRWVTLAGLVVVMGTFSLWTADAVLGGDPLNTALRFVIGTALGAVCLLLYRTFSIIERRV